MSMDSKGGFRCWRWLHAVGQDETFGDLGVRDCNAVEIGPCAMVIEISLANGSSGRYRPDHLPHAEVKALASDNRMVIEKAGVDAEVAKLSTLFSIWRNQRYANESEVGGLRTG